MQRSRGPAQSLLLVVMLCAGPAPAGADDAYDGVRQQFLLSYTALRSGLPVPEAIDSDTLRAYPLYPYLQAARIERALSDGRGDADARRFLARHDDEPVGRSLRRAWLRSLAAREHWDAFVDEHRPAVADETLHCQFLRAHVELGRTDGLAERLIEQWRTPRQLPTQCEPGFQWLREQGLLDDALIEQRVRLLLDNGQAAFARVIARRLPAERAAPLLRWADLIEQPRRIIDTIIAVPGTEIESIALHDGWMRLARNSPGPALERYSQLIAARAYDDAHASPYALRLALGLSWDRRPEALEYFERVQDPDIDDYALEWQTRAALWAGDWHRAQRSIEAMSDGHRSLSRWRYWAARSAEALGDPQRAGELYRSVLDGDNYYAAIAAARLGRAAAPNPEPLALDDTLLREIAAQPPFQRARELLLAGLRAQAISEWYFGLGRLEDRARTHAIALAADWAWYDVSIATATRQSVFNDYALLYPTPYDEQVSAAAELGDHAPELLYGIVRQESLFHPEAVSAAGALGLAQLLLDTARRTARQWDRPQPRRIELFDPDVNLALAAAHLRDLLEQFDGQIKVALAAYNAGANAARRWLPEQAIDADIWIENIPFNETREYVQRVLWHSVVFAWLRSGEPQDTHAWLEAVARARDDGAATRRTAALAED